MPSPQPPCRPIADSAYETLAEAPYLHVLALLYTTALLPQFSAAWVACERAPPRPPRRRGLGLPPSSARHPPFNRSAHALRLAVT